MTTHSSLDDQLEIHVPKGFTEASADTIPSKNNAGELTWINKDEVGGPQGPAGPAGSLATISVADASNPIELSTISDLDVGVEVIATQEIAGEIDIQTLYIYDADASNYPKVAPYILATSKGGNTAWIAGTGAYGIAGPISTLTGERFINVDEQVTAGVVASTGVLVLGDITVNVDPTKFDLGVTSGCIVDSHTDPENTVIKRVSYAGELAVGVTGLLTGSVTYLALDAGALNPLTGTYDGVIVQSPTAFTTEQLRDYIYIGLVTHTQNVIIESVVRTARPLIAPSNQLDDLAEAVGVINVTGNIYSNSGANLFLNKSQGEIFSLGANYALNAKDPNKVNVASATSFSWFYNYQDGVGGFNIIPSITNVDSNNYDNGSGVLATVSNNQFQIQRLFLSPSGITIIHYGQATYANLASAESALNTEVFERNPQLAGTLLRSYLIIKKGVTDLDAAIAAGDAKFINGGKFDESLIGGASSATTTQQQAYNNSTPNPEIVTDNVGGAMTYRRGSSLETDDVLEVQNGAGTQTFAVAGDGSVGVGGEASTAVLTVHDNGTALNPIVNVSADDESPWALVVNNTTYSATDTHGLKFSVGDDGNSLIYAADNGVVAGELRLGVDNTNKIIADTTSVRVETQAYSLLNALVDAAFVATDCSLGNVHKVTLAGNRTLTNPTNLKAGSTYIWLIDQDVTGSRTLTFDSQFQFPDGADKDLSTIGSSKDVLTAVYDGSFLRCSLAKAFS